MKLRWFCFLIGAVVVVATGCGGVGPSSPTLTPAEQVLVEVYVRIAHVEAMRSVSPDSVGPALDALARDSDSTAVRQALDGLRAEPQRWEYVYDEIVKRLQAEDGSSPADGPGRDGGTSPPVNDR